MHCGVQHMVNSIQYVVCICIYIYVSMVYSTCCVVCSLWYGYMVYGTWCIVYSVWHMLYIAYGT